MPDPSNYQQSQASGSPQQSGVKKKASGLNNTGVLSTLAVVVLIVVVLQGWDDNPIVAGAIVAGVIGLAVFWWSRFIRAKRRRNQ